MLVSGGKKAQWKEHRLWGLASEPSTLLNSYVALSKSLSSLSLSSLICKMVIISPASQGCYEVGMCYIIKDLAHCLVYRSCL